MRNCKLSGWTLVVTNILIFPTPQWPVLKYLLPTTFPLSFRFHLFTATERNATRGTRAILRCKLLCPAVLVPVCSGKVSMVLPHPHTWQLVPPLAPWVQRGQLTPCCKAGNAPKPSAAGAHFPINPLTQSHWNPLFFSLGTTPSTSFP